MKDLRKMAVCFAFGNLQRFERNWTGLHLLLQSAEAGTVQPLNCTRFFDFKPNLVTGQGYRT